MPLPRPTRRILLTSGLAAGLAGLTRRGAAAAPGRRIVSVGGAITEILYRLGVQDEVVGVATTSRVPSEALATTPSVGDGRALGAEGVLSLQPTLILAVDGAGPPDVLKILEGAGLPVVRVPDDPSPAGVSAKIAVIAGALGEVPRGDALIREVEAGFTRLEEERSRLDRPARALFVLSLQNGRPLVGG
ncbi:MAG: ABC transporter substrate-binding protein, partial [Microvirga sp.]